MARSKFYLLRREPQGNFPGSYVIINRATLSPTGDGPWPMTKEGRKAAQKTLDGLTVEPHEEFLPSIYHVNGEVTHIARYRGPNNRWLFRLSGTAIDGRRLSSKDWISYEVAMHEACTPRSRAGGGKVLAGMGAGPKAKNKRSLTEIEMRRRQSKEY